MKKSNIYILQAIKVLLLLVLVASCSQDDYEQGMSLPAGQYPLDLSVSLEGLKTRAVGKDSWSVEDEIGVRIGSDAERGRYTLNSDGSVNIEKSANILHWKTTSPATVKAWYPFEPKTDVSIADQSKLSDFSSIDYLAATAENQSYKNSVGLTFQHQMAKVRCELVSAKESGISSNEVRRATVTFQGCPVASFADGVLTGSGSGDIVPIKSTSDNSHEALLVPADMTGKELFRVDINVGGYDKSFSYTPSGDYADLKPGTSYVFTVTLDRDQMVVSAISASWDGDEENLFPNAIPLQLYLPEEFFTLLNEEKLKISENARPSDEFCLEESGLEDIIPQEDLYLVDGNTFTISLSLDESGENFLKGFNVTEGIATVNRVRIGDRHEFTIKANAERVRLEYGDYMQVGDYLYSNGKWRPDIVGLNRNDDGNGGGSGNNPPDNYYYGYGYDDDETWECIGVVFKVGPGEGDKVENYGGRLETIHGYAVALHDAAPPAEIGSWGKGLSEEAEIGVYSDRYINIYDGYTNTQKMLEIANKNTDKLDSALGKAYWAFYKINEYNDSVKVPQDFSTWYLPSIGQLSDLYKFAGRRKCLIMVGGEDVILSDAGIFPPSAPEFDPSGSKYWSSTQAPNDNAWTFRFLNGIIIESPKTTPTPHRLLNRSRVRAVLTF